VKETSIASLYASPAKAAGKTKEGDAALNHLKASEQ
jgi:hypothetical protein